MCVCEEIVTCVFWILKSMEALLAASSLGMLSSMAVKKKSKNDIVTQFETHERNVDDS